MRAPAILAAILTTFVAPLFLLCMHRLEAPIVGAVFSSGVDEVPALALEATLAAGAVGGLAAAAVLLGSAYRWASRSLEVAARCAVAGAVLLVLLGGRRALLPEPARYLESLPVVGVLPAVVGPPVRLEAGMPWTWDQSAVHEATVGDALISRVCNAHVCGLVIGRASPGIGLWGEHAATVIAHRPVVLRRDARLGLWIAEQDGVRRALRHGAAVKLDARDVAAVTGPPPAWWLAATLGATCAALALWAARASDRKRRRIEAALPAMVREDGWLEVDDGLAPRRIGGVLPSGPAVLLAGVPAAGAYRGGSDRGHLVLSGERAALSADARAHAVAARALTLALALLAMAPLAAAARVGLVSPF